MFLRSTMGILRPKTVQEPLVVMLKPKAETQKANFDALLVYTRPDSPRVFPSNWKFHTILICDKFRHCFGRNDVGIGLSQHSTHCVQLSDTKLAVSRSSLAEQTSPASLTILDNEVTSTARNVFFFCQKISEGFQWNGFEAVLLSHQLWPRLESVSDNHASVSSSISSGLALGEPNRIWCTSDRKMMAAKITNQIRKWKRCVNCTGS